MSGWRCVPVGCGAVVCRVAPAVLAAWIAAHPVPVAEGCQVRVRCHWVIPREAFVPGGEIDKLMGRAPAALASLLPPPAVPQAPAQPVPAPAAWAMMAAALLALAAVRRVIA